MKTKKRESFLGCRVFPIKVFLFRFCDFLKEKKRTKDFLVRLGAVGFLYKFTSRLTSRKIVNQGLFGNTGKSLVLFFAWRKSQNQKDCLETRGSPWFSFLLEGNLKIKIHWIEYLFATKFVKMKHTVKGTCDTHALGFHRIYKCMFEYLLLCGNLFFYKN